VTAKMPGQHSFCFNNKMSRWTPKIVSFGAGRDASKVPEVAKLEHLGPVVDSVIKVNEKLAEIEKLEHYLRVREQKHRDTQESTNDRVQWMSVFEAVLLLSISALQLYYIQSWFGDTKNRRRV